MTVQRVPIGIRLGVSHYWELPFYKLKYVAFSYALLKYLRLLVLSFFIFLKKNRIVYKKGSVIIKEFFVKVRFNFWESNKLNTCISFIGKARYSKGTKRRQTFEKYLKFKKDMDLKFLKLRLLTLKSLPIYLAETWEYAYSKKWLMLKSNKFGNNALQSRVCNTRTNFYIHLYNFIVVFLKKPITAYYKKTSKIKTRLYYIWDNYQKYNKLENVLGTSKNSQLIVLLDICQEPFNSSRSCLNTTLTNALFRYLTKLFINISVLVNLNIGWPLIQYLYFCYILYSCYFKRFAMEKNLTRYYHFYSRAVLGFYLQELSIVFKYFQQKFAYRRLKNIRFTNKVLFNFVKKLKVLPFKYFGISTVNVQFKGRAWAKKKKWAKTKKISILDPGNPLSTLKVNYIYIAKNYNTKFGTYGIKVWMTYSKQDIKQNLIDFLNSDALDNPGQIRFITKEISWVSI